MNLSESTHRAWTRVRSCPVPGVELCIDGSFRIGERRFSAKAGLSGYQVGETRVDREPGTDRPLVAESSLGRVFLLYHDGLWYQSQDIPFATPVEAEHLPLEFVGQNNGVPVAVPAAEAVDLPCVEPGSIKTTPVPAPNPTRRASGRWSVLSLVLLVLATLALSGLFQLLSATEAATAGRVAGWCSFDEQTWLKEGAYHSLITHAFLHTSGWELAYFTVGILLFGWIVQRNVGFLRTVLLFLFCAAAGVGFWQGAKTEFGQDILVRVVGKAFAWIAERVGLETAVTAWLAYGRAMDAMLALRGAVCGAAGAVAGLIAFAACRRQLNGTTGVRWLVVLLAAGYLALGWAYVWPELLGREVPYVLFVGGALGGLFFIFPDKFLNHLGEAVKDRIQERS
jgi:hypothetical protein